MKISRIIYGLLTAALTWAYFMPWLIDHGQNFPGWATVLFSFFYFVGVSIAIVIFFTGYRAVGLSIFAGVIMIASNLLTGIFLGISMAAGFGQLGSGFGLAFVMSLVYLILGPICGSKFDKSKNVRVSGEGFLSKFIGGIAIAIIAGLLLKYLFHIG